MFAMVPKRRMRSVLCSLLFCTCVLGSLVAASEDIDYFCRSWLYDASDWTGTLWGPLTEAGTYQLNTHGSVAPNDQIESIIIESAPYTTCNLTLLADDCYRIDKDWKVYTVPPNTTRYLNYLVPADGDNPNANKASWSSSGSQITCIRVEYSYNHPTSVPTNVPVAPPTAFPTTLPTTVPTNVPTIQPTMLPSMMPTIEPTRVPSIQPKGLPSDGPTLQSTDTSSNVVATSNIIGTDDGIEPVQSDVVSDAAASSTTLKSEAIVANGSNSDREDVTTTTAVLVVVCIICMGFVFVLVYFLTRFQRKRSASLLASKRAVPPPAEVAEIGANAAKKDVAAAMAVADMEMLATPGASNGSTDTLEVQNVRRKNESCSKLLDTAQAGPGQLVVVGEDDGIGAEYGEGLADNDVGAQPMHREGKASVVARDGYDPMDATGARRDEKQSSSIASPGSIVVELDGADAGDARDAGVEVEKNDLEACSVHHAVGMQYVAGGDNFVDMLKNAQVNEDIMMDDIAEHIQTAGK